MKKDTKEGKNKKKIERRWIINWSVRVKQRKQWEVKCTVKWKSNK